MKRSTFQAIIFSILIVIVSAVIAVVFIMDHHLKGLGYTTEQIARFKQYEIQDKVQTYNPALLKALSSDAFDRDNLDYYILFESDEDVTRDINDLAKKYTYDDFSKLHSILSNEEMLSLVFMDRIPDLETFIKIKEHGYDLQSAYKAVEQVPKSFLQHFLVSPVYNQRFLDCYIKLANAGYTYSFIDYVHDNYDDDLSEFIASFRYFEVLEELIQTEGFKLENAPRYLWYKNRYASYENTRIIENVNAGKDIPSSINYSDLYNNSVVVTSPDPFYVLVNKQHRLSDDYQPPELVSIDAEYRGSNTPVNAEVLAAFKEMADAYLQSHTERLIIQDGYIPFSAQQELYESTLAELTEVDEENTIIDTFLARAGYSEHQTGMAVNVTEKGTSIYNLEGTETAQWLEENASLYGFILRYPKDRDFITGYSYIPYQYRYVNKLNSRMISRLSWTYEEFYYMLIGE